MSAVSHDGIIPQAMKGPGMQVPNTQLSEVVQGLPSSQEAVLLTLWQPSGPGQESSVQGLPSLQSGGAPPTQLPPAQ
jgi:hypothetical protein